MGMIQDMRHWQSLARIDDEMLREKIQAARNLVYQKNYAVDNERVEALLKEHSLVPTAVKFQAPFINLSSDTTFCGRMHSPKSWRIWG